MFFDWSFAASEDTLKTHKAKQRGYRSARLSHKAMCRGLSCDSHSKTLTSTPRMNMVIYAFGNCGIYAFECFWVTLLMGKGTTWLWTQKVDLSKLDMPALQRYIRHFNLVSSRGTFSWLPVKLWKWVFVFFLTRCGLSLCKVDTLANPTKEQLLDIVQRHFMSQVKILSSSNNWNQKGPKCYNIFFFFDILSPLWFYRKWMSFRL